jgi:imidazolonepropionase-like amidohydrolase
MVAQGMPPAAALIAATRGGAALLGLDDVGEIVAGMRADLLLVAGNPLEEIACLAAVRGVWSNGRRVAMSEAAA